MLDEEAEKKALEDAFPVDFGDFGATFVLCFVFLLLPSSVSATWTQMSCF